MSTFDVASKVSLSGEYILGADQTGSHGCYLIYGVLKAGEGGRELRPGKGHEEIVLVLRGDLFVRGHYAGPLKEGQALHLRDDENCLLDNPGDGESLYVIAGGHSEGGRH
ncbi:MAG: hypothetical protein AABZ15_12575 [Nitrospirota bacterium]